MCLAGPIPNARRQSAHSARIHSKHCIVSYCGKRDVGHGVLAGDAMFLRGVVQQGLDFVQLRRLRPLLIDHKAIAGHNNLGRPYLVLFLGAFPLLGL